MAWGPDGALYFNQGSNSAMGAPDNAWALRPERQLNGAVLRLDTGRLPTSLPLDVKTVDGGGTYDPFGANAALTIFGSGVRNAYDLVWHSNGQLYVPTNGSASGGNTPGTPTPLPASCANRIDSVENGAYTGPNVNALNAVGEQHDYLFRVVKGGYYGHPNPVRCEWVLNGGNPTSGTDAAQVTAYPTGTQPDRNWRGNAFDFGLHYSPNGVIEYRSNTFGGTLRGKLLVVRYSAADDVIVLTPDELTKDIVASQTGVTGLTGFTNPLDLIEDTTRGNIYVAEYPDPSQSTLPSRIVLLRPVGAGAVAPNITTSPGRLIFNQPTGSGCHRRPGRDDHQHRQRAAVDLRDHHRRRECRAVRPGRCPDAARHGACRWHAHPAGHVRSVDRRPQGRRAADRQRRCRDADHGRRPSWLGHARRGWQQRAVPAVDPRHLRDPGERR